MRWAVVLILACRQPVPPEPLSNRLDPDFIEVKWSPWWQDQCRQAGGYPYCQRVTFADRAIAHPCWCERKKPP